MSHQIWLRFIQQILQSRFSKDHPDTSSMCPVVTPCISIWGSQNRAVVTFLWPEPPWLTTSYMQNKSCKHKIICLWFRSTHNFGNPSPNSKITPKLFWGIPEGLSLAFPSKMDYYNSLLTRLPTFPLAPQKLPKESFQSTTLMSSFCFNSPIAFVITQLMIISLLLG